MVSFVWKPKQTLLGFLIRNQLDLSAFWTDEDA
jgi:hypothetical protein